MATRKSNGRNLEEAVAILLGNQAQFIATVARMDERLAHMERLLMEHHRMLLDLPEAIREKIGFKSK